MGGLLRAYSVIGTMLYRNHNWMKQVDRFHFINEATPAQKSGKFCPLKVTELLSGKRLESKSFWTSVFSCIVPEAQKALHTACSLTSLRFLFRSYLLETLSLITQTRALHSTLGHSISPYLASFYIAALITT